LTRAGNSPSGTACKTCQGALLAEELFCPACGTPARGVTAGGAAIIPCEKCGTVIGPGELFCSGCGTLRPGSSPGGDASPGRRSDAAWQGIASQLRAAIANDYDLLGELGRGGMAAVFLAYEKKLGRKVAIKVISPELSFSDDAIARFDHEARTMARLKHRNIVGIYNVWTTPVHHFVMEYVEGQSLDAILRRLGPLPIPAIQGVLHDVGTALGYAHRQQIVHRDIKGSNILVDRAGNAMVSDFGIAKALAGTTNRETGFPVGTPQFISPEQLLMRPISGRTDQYSLGVVIFELVTGKLPFTGWRVEVEQGHLNQVPARVDSLRRDCPSWMADAVARMLEKDPEKRFPEMADAMKALGATAYEEGEPVRRYWGEAAGGAQPSPPKISISEPGSRGRERRGPSRTVTTRLIGGLGAIGVAAAAWLVFKPEPKPKRDTLPESTGVVKEKGPTIDNDGKEEEASKLERRLVNARRSPNGPIIVDDTVSLTAAVTGVANPSFSWQIVRGAGSIRVLGPLTGSRLRVLATDSGRVELRAEGGAGTTPTTIGFVISRPALTALRIERAPDSIAVGQSVTLAVAATDARGRDYPIAGVEWNAIPADRAAIDRQGRLTAKQTGEATIIAALEGRTTQTRVMIHQVVQGDDGTGPVPSSAPPNRSADRAAVERLSRAIFDLVKNKDGDRLSDLYRAEPGSSPTWRSELVEGLRESVSATLTRQTEPTFDGDDAAVAALDVQVRYRNPVVAGTKSTTLKFLVRYSRLGGDWSIRSVSLTGRPF
jgi:serine/threonine-protein kinase